MYITNLCKLTCKLFPHQGASVSLVREGKPEDQPDISRALQTGDYAAFRAHLQGYISVFNIPLEPRVRPVLASALQALEADLISMQDAASLTQDSINSSSMGHVIGSRGGLGVKILYFYNNALPSNTLPSNTHSRNSGMFPSNRGVLPSNNFESDADSCTIGVECSNINQLPTEPLYIGGSKFKPLSQSNSGTYHVGVDL